MSIKLAQQFNRTLSNFINNNLKPQLEMRSKAPYKIFNVSDQKAITFATKCLEDGKVIALPTDTIYGLACNANCSKAIQQLYDIKGRDLNKPLAICVANLKSLKFCGEADHLPDELLKKLLPGPFTIVLNKTTNLSNPNLNPGINKIGIRIPDFKFIQELCDDFAKPLALTSANKSNEPSTLCIEEFENLWPSLGAVFDAGKISLNESNRVGSTVIDLSIPGKCKVIRKGLAYEKTIKVMNEFKIIVE